MKEAKIRGEEAGKGKVGRGRSRVLTVAPRPHRE